MNHAHVYTLSSWASGSSFIHVYTLSSWRLGAALRSSLHSPCFSWVQPYTSRPGTHALPRVPSCTSPTGTSAHLQHKHPSSTESTLGVLRGF